MSADYVIDPNAALRHFVEQVERYAGELAHHIAFTGEGPDSYAFDVAIEIHQGLLAALAGQEPHFTTVAFVGRRNQDSARRKYNDAYNDAYNEGHNDGLLLRTQEGEGSDV